MIELSYEDPKQREVRDCPEGPLRSTVIGSRNFHGKIRLGAVERSLVLRLSSAEKK